MGLLDGFLATTTHPLLIGGKPAPSTDGRTLPVVDPATGETIGEVQRASAKDAARAVEAAEEAFLDGRWSERTPQERSDILFRMAEIMAREGEALARAEMRNTGKPIQMARDVDVAFSVDNTRFFAGASRVVHTLGQASYFPGTLSTVRREPLGVVASIAPWNYPLNMAVWKVMPALAMGNTVVLKPASLTPLTALALGQIGLEAGLPEGVLNVVTGPGEEIGEVLTTHPAVRMVSVTGDTATGKEVMRQASGTVKKLHLELGGKAPFVVFEDADPRAAAHGAVMGAFMNAGQDCTAATRVYCQEGLMDRFLEILLDLVGKIRVGLPDDPGTEVGSLISHRHRERVAGFVERAREGGARVMAGGRAPADPSLAAGAFYMPTVLRPGSQHDEIVQQEVFGPVLVVLPFRDEEEAVRLANDTVYGLAASVWTRDTFRATRLAMRIQAGTVWVNEHIAIASEMPHGGYKESGFGKDMSFYALEEYSQVKHVLADTTGKAVKDWYFIARGD